MTDYLKKLSITTLTDKVTPNPFPSIQGIPIFEYDFTMSILFRELIYILIMTATH